MICFGMIAGHMSLTFGRIVRGVQSCEVKALNLDNFEPQVGYTCKLGSAIFCGHAKVCQ